MVPGGWISPNVLGKGLLWVGASLLLVVLERSGLPGRFLTGEPERPLWIWVPDDLRDARQLSVYFVRDVELLEVPSGAAVEILGDAEYVFWLNGHRIGSGRAQVPARVDRYPVERWLQPGQNRFLVEVRSPTAAGGFRFVARDETGASWLESDGRWHLARSYTAGMEWPGGWYRAEAVRVLGPGPLGRWAGAQVEVRVPFEEELSVHEVRIAHQFRTPSEPGVWYPLSQAPHGVVDLGSAVEFDFGNEEVGYLQLSLSRRSRAGLAFFSSEPFREVPMETQALVLPVPERGLWQDSELRRFRYVLVLGLEGVRSAAVLPVRPERFRPKGEPNPPRGLLGLRPPRSRAPIDHVIRRELQHLTGWP